MTRKIVEVEEKRKHTVKARMIPLFGIEFHDTQLRAFTIFGRTPEQVAQNGRNLIQKHLPRQRWDVTVEYENPETFEKMGVNLDPDVQ